MSAFSILASAILATIIVGTGTITAMPKKNINTADSETRLMAMLYVSTTSTR